MGFSSERGFWERAASFCSLLSSWRFSLNLLLHSDGDLANNESPSSCLLSSSWHSRLRNDRIISGQLASSRGPLIPESGSRVIMSTSATRLLSALMMALDSMHRAVMILAQLATLAHSASVLMQTLDCSLD